MDDHRGLRVRGMTKRFGTTEVLRDVSLDATYGRITALLGPNGAGKSTLFRILMGLVSEDAGEAAIDGATVLGLPLHHKARVGLGYLPQESASFPELSVGANLRGLLELLPLARAEREARREELLTRVGLSLVADRPVRVLSAGERRRLEIAKALATRPKVLLLDEPFSGLDPRIVEDLAAIFRTLAESGVAVLLTDHQVHMTLARCDFAVLLANGAVLCAGTAREVSANDEARRLYLGHDFAIGGTS